MRTSRWRAAGLFSFVAMIAATAGLRAQSVLYVQLGNQWRPVCDVQRETPFTLVDGRPEAVEENLSNSYAGNPESSGTGFGFKPAKLYAPAVVKIGNLDTRFSSHQSERVNRMKKGMSFRASFDSSAPLDHTYVALEVTAKTGARRIFVQEIGVLKPHRPRNLTLDRTFDQDFEPVKCEVHVFSGNSEMMTSELSADQIAQALDRLVEAQLKDRTRANPEPLIAPPPEYPPELRDAKTKGRAVVDFKVTPEGRVENPQLKEASHPAFGAAALATLAQWRFVPAVQDGNPVAAAVSMPFIFAP